MLQKWLDLRNSNSSTSNSNTDNTRFDGVAKERDRCPTNQPSSLSNILCLAKHYMSYVVFAVLSINVCRMRPGALLAMLHTSCDTRTVSHIRCIVGMPSIVIQRHDNPMICGTQYPNRTINGSKHWITSLNACVYICMCAVSIKMCVNRFMHHAPASFRLASPFETCMIPLDTGCPPSTEVCSCPWSWIGLRYL